MRITKKGVFLVGIVAAAALALTACSDQTPGTSTLTHKAGAPTQDEVVKTAPVAKAKDLAGSPTIDAIKKAGILQAGGDSATPLFSQLDPATGEHLGFDAGLAYSFAKYVLGKPNVNFTDVNVVNREALLQNHTVQWITDSYSITPQRAALVNFAGPYMISGTTIGILATNKTIKKVADLNGKPVATLAGLTETSLLSVAPQAQATTFDSNDEATNALLQGRADAIALAQPTLLGLINTNKKIKLMSPKPINQLYFGIGLPKDDPEYKDIVNKWLGSIEKSGYYQKLWESTVGDVSPTNIPKIGPVPTPAP